jgi:eukaryotic-like serine/threonine-protein kinase
MKDFFKFLQGKTFWKHFSLIIASGLFLLLATSIGLKLFTKHGRTYAVPDLRGLTVDEAEMVVRARKLNYKVADSVYISQEESGRVVDQNPAPNFRVKENRTIFLTINAIDPERVSMPDVTGVSLRQARALIETYGLAVGKLIYVPDIAVNNVLRQQYQGEDVKPGELIIRGESIDLVLGEGLSKQTTAVPDLWYISHSDARNRILEASLNVGATLYDQSIKTGRDSLNAFVWRQRPEFTENRQIPLGSEIDLWLSRDSTLIPSPVTGDISIPEFDE